MFIAKFLPRNFLQERFLPPGILFRIRQTERKLRQETEKERASLHDSKKNPFLRVLQLSAHSSIKHSKACLIVSPGVD